MCYGPIRVTEPLHPESKTSERLPFIVAHACTLGFSCVCDSVGGGPGVCIIICVLIVVAATSDRRNLPADIPLSGNALIHPGLFHNGIPGPQVWCGRRRSTHKNVRGGYNPLTGLTEVSGTVYLFLQNQVRFGYTGTFYSRTHRNFGYGYDYLTDLTEFGGTALNLTYTTPT